MKNITSVLINNYVGRLLQYYHDIHTSNCSIFFQKILIFNLGTKPDRIKEAKMIWPGIQGSRDLRSSPVLLPYCS